MLTYVYMQLFSQIAIANFAKHCKLCDSCCLGFDHHCMWLTRCIGYNTHRYFVVFLMCIVLDSILFIYHAFASEYIYGHI